MHAKMTSKKMGEKQLTNKNTVAGLLFTKTAHFISSFFCKKCTRRLTFAGFFIGTEIIIFLETAVKKQQVFIFKLIHRRAKITLFIQHFWQVYKGTSFGSKNVHNLYIKSVQDWSFRSGTQTIVKL